MVDHDYLRTGADVASWCEREAGRVPRVSAARRGGAIDEIRAMRDDVKAVLRATVDGERRCPAPRDRAAQRAGARRCRSSPSSARTPGELRHGPATRAGAVDELLARVAAATIELVGSGGRDAVRFCDAPSCGDFFAPERREPALVRRLVRDARPGRPARAAHRGAGA